MDRTHQLDYLSIFSRASKRMAALPRLSPALLRGCARIGPALLVLVAVVLALIAHQVSSGTALTRWLEEHGPEVDTVTHGLCSIGYSEARNESEPKKKALRALPPGLEGSGTFWISERAGWAVYFGRYRPGHSPDLYCLECTEAPRSWELAGQGWSGFEALLAIGKAARPEKKKPPLRTRKRAISSPDPRQIRY